jgi:hypothetical protein
VVASLLGQVVGVQQAPVVASLLVLAVGFRPVLVVGFQQAPATTGAAFPCRRVTDDKPKNSKLKVGAGETADAIHNSTL